MLAEACATGKPIKMFDTEQGHFAMRDDNNKIYWRGRTLTTTIFRIAMRVAPTRWSRDLRIVHQQLLGSGQAHWIGDATPPQNATPTTSALELATSRIKSLFEI